MYSNRCLFIRGRAELLFLASMTTVDWSCWCFLRGISKSQLLRDKVRWHLGCRPQRVSLRTEPTAGPLGIPLGGSLDPVVACPAVQFEPCPISRGIHSYLVLDRLAAGSRGEPLWPIETNSMRMAHLWSLTDKPMLRWPLSVNIGVSENWGSTISIQFPENAVLAPFFCCFSLVVFVLLIVISIYVP